MQYISFSGDPHRQKHFDFFNRMDQPHFNICANVPLGSFRLAIAEQKLKFTSALVYLIARTANELVPFRWRIREGKVVEHATVQPSFTVKTDASEVFSFCTVEYQPDRQAFLEATEREMEAMQTQPSFEDEPGRDDYLFLSSIPWVSFTSVSHAMHYSPVDSVPRITWGKSFEQGGALLLPLSVQAHHALVDGSDMGAYFERLTGYLQQPHTWL